MSVNTIFRQQHGVITRRQARHAGLTNHQIDRLLRNREWVSVHRGVFRHAAIAPTWRGRVVAAVSASGGAASHRCSAALWGLELLRRPRVELTIAASRRTPAGLDAIVHRTSQWALTGKTVRHGIATTGIDRTLLDCASVVPPSTLERLAESAIRQQLTSWQRLARTLDEQSATGRNGCAPLRALLRERLGAPIVPRSDFSRGVEHLLKRAGLPPCRLEYPIHDQGGRLLLLADLAWPSRRCAVELDGLQHHFGRRDRERDIERRAEVRATGWRVLELGWKLYASDPDRVVDLVRRFLGPDRI